MAFFNLKIANKVYFYQPTFDILIKCKKGQPNEMVF